MRAVFAPAEAAQRRKADAGAVRRRDRRCRPDRDDPTKPQLKLGPMRARTLILFLVALMLAGGTAMLVRSWLAQQRTVEAEAAPMPPPPVAEIRSRRAVPQSPAVRS